MAGTLFPLGLRQAYRDPEESSPEQRRRRRRGMTASVRRAGRRLRERAARVASAARARGVTGARVAGGLCAVCAVYAWVSAAQAERLADASTLGADGQYLAALREARSVSLSPASTEAVVTEALALQDLGRLRAAAAVYARAAGADSGDWSIRLNWADDLAQEHHAAAARLELAEALRLNPLLMAPRPLWPDCLFASNGQCVLRGLSPIR
jgi:hypothetical protein